MLSFKLRSLLRVSFGGKRRNKCLSFVLRRRQYGNPEHFCSTSSSDKNTLEKNGFSFQNIV